MKYTDKEYYINEKLREKLDLMIERVVEHKFDNLIIIDGKEGYGKSNLASGIAYYIAYKSKREFSINNVFFSIDEMIDFAIKTEKQVIWWDEAALGGLALESYRKIQIKLLKLLMIARKKQHFYIFVIPKYFKLREAIIDRAVALVHSYSRDEVTRGRFAYYKTDSLERMYLYWMKSRQKGYKKFFNFLGTFPESLPLIIDEKEYDKKKDNAILSLGESEVENKKFIELTNKLKALQYVYATIPDISQKILAKHGKISTKTISRWKNMKNFDNNTEKEDEDTGTLY